MDGDVVLINGHSSFLLLMMGVKSSGPLSGPLR